MATPLLVFDVVAEQRVLVAEVEPAVGDDRVRPARLAAVLRQLELAVYPVALRRCLDEGHRPVLVTEVEPAVGIEDGRRAAAGAAVLAPGDFADLELNTDGEAL